MSGVSDGHLERPFCADSTGRRLGVYYVHERIGAGGIGEVHRARDTRLGRDVVIKILRPTFVADRDRLARFEREARVLASLNHRNVGAIHGLEDAQGLRERIIVVCRNSTPNRTSTLPASPTSRR